MVIRGSYPEDGPYRGQFDKFFTFRAFLAESKSEIIIPGATVFEWNYTPKEFVPCDKVRESIGEVNYSEADFKGALCFEFDPNFEVGGSYGDGHAKSVVIHLDPCKPPAVGRTNECMAKRYNKDGTVDDVDTIYGPPYPPPLLGEENLTVVAEYLQNFSVDIGYIEDSPGLEDYDNSMIRNLIFLD